MVVRNCCWQDRAAVWNARPENRQLPSLWQWLRIRWLTAKKNWTPPQQKMMAKAGRISCVAGGGSCSAADRGDDYGPGNSRKRSGMNRRQRHAARVGAKPS